MAPVTAVVIGAGSRGQNYAMYSLDFPDKFKVVGVVEPRQFYRERMANTYKVPQDAVFADWESFVTKDKMADCVLVCTPDRHHKAPAVACAKMRYHVLLEKPMATTLEDCEEIVRTCKESNVLLAVCHVLRYTPQAMKIREIIQSGAIGDVCNIQLLEPVGYFHFAHSYVRGNWHNSATSSFSLLAKSCHDLDLLHYWMTGSKVKAVSSFGSLKHFNKGNKPPGAASRCLDCSVEASCPYSAKKIYLDGVKQGNCGWPVSVITEVPDIESVTDALKSGPYGRCVYESDNDVMDNQVVNLQFEGGATASFSMVAFTEKVCARQARIFGTKGELVCDFDQLGVRQFDFLSQEPVYHDVSKQAVIGQDSRLRGHGGADFHAMEAFVTAIQTNDPSLILTGPEETLYSHRLCFMAEKARLENTVVNMH